MCVFVDTHVNLHKHITPILHKTNKQNQKMSASFFSKQVATGVKAYEAAAANDGAVYVKLR